MTPERRLLREARDALEPGRPLGPQYMNTLDGRAEWLDATRPLRAEIDALLARPEGQNNAAGQDDRELPDSADGSDPSQLSPAPAAPSEKDGESTASRCPSCGQQMRGTDWVDRMLADNARLEQELTQACLERDSARNVLARAISNERLANMRADQAEEAREAAQSAAAPLKMPTAAEIRLAAGELTAEEMRAVKAVLGWFIRRADNRKAQEGKDG